jgi:hypothetical protein
MFVAPIFIVRVSFRPMSIAPMRNDPYDVLTGHQDGIRICPGTGREGHAMPVARSTSMSAFAPVAGKATRGAVTRELLSAIGKGVLVAVSGVAIALCGAAAAAAQPGVVDAQSGSTVDVDGTQGTMVPAMTGDQRSLTTQSSDGHAIVSDACAIKGKGCLPPASFDPTTISATTGISDDPDSALDPDGYQTNTGG